MKRVTRRVVRRATTKRKTTPKPKGVSKLGAIIVKQLAKTKATNASEEKTPNPLALKELTTTWNFQKNLTIVRSVHH